MSRGILLTPLKTALGMLFIYGVLFSDGYSDMYRRVELGIRESYFQWPLLVMAEEAMLLSKASPFTCDMDPISSTLSKNVSSCK